MKLGGNRPPGDNPLRQAICYQSPNGELLNSVFPDTDKVIYTQQEKGKLVAYITTAWTPLHGHHCMDTTAWTPLHGHHCMDTTAWTPLHGHNCMDTTAWTPLHGHHCMDTTAWTPLHGHNCMDTTAWTQLHGHNCMLNLRRVVDLGSVRYYAAEKRLLFWTASLSSWRRFTPRL